MLRTQKVLSTVLCCLVLAAWAGSAEAACYANFSGNCTRSSGGPASCVFDGNRTYTYDTTPTTCGSSTVQSVFWEFDYPNDAGTWDDLFTGTSYPDPAALGDDAVVRMTLICADGCTATKSRYVIFVTVGCPGCINMNVGWR